MDEEKSTKRTVNPLNERTEMELKTRMKDDSGDDNNSDDDILDEDADDNGDADDNEDEEDEIDDGCGELSRYQYRQIYQLDPHHEDYESGDLCENDEDDEEGKMDEEIYSNIGTGEDWDNRPTYNEIYGGED